MLVLLRYDVEFETRDVFKIDVNYEYECTCMYR